MSSEARFAAVAAAILLAWGGTAIYLEKESKTLQREYEERSKLLLEYDRLSSLYSSKAQKEALKRMERMLKMYGVSFQTKKSGGKKIYIFSLNAKNIDKIMEKVLNSSIAIESLSVKRVSNDRVDVNLGVAQ